VGLVKDEEVPPSDRLGVPYITAKWEDAEAIASAGADIVALDATGRPRLDGMSLKETIHKIHMDLDKAVWADVASLSQALNAVACGADVVSTTLFGYTEETALEPEAGPSFDLLKEM